jgi:tRNA G18 (ribose-2'-O)-methylase SpoU
MNKKIKLIVPNIRSAHNVGAMFRIADAFAVEKIYLCGYTPNPPKRKISKVALGAEEWIDWEQIDNTSRLIKELKQNDFEVVGLEKNESSQTITDTSFSDKMALIVGQEVSGLDQELLDECDKIIHIPMHGNKESLNVSVATGIALNSIVN